MQLFVIGMHRSGTSAVTRLLNMAGAYFGPEGSSNGADEGNPKGFWERLDVRAACDGLLQESGFDWWRVADFSVDRIPSEVSDRYLAQLRTIIFELDAHRPWVVKEPRLSLLFPLIRPLLEVPVCIHVTREPVEVAQSLEIRNAMPMAAGLGLWETYTRHAFEATHGLPRLLVRYEDLMSDPTATVGQLIEQLTALGVQGLRLPSDLEITSFVTSDLHRQRRSAGERLSWLNDAQLRLAASADDGRIPEPGELGNLSGGATDALRTYTEHRDQYDQLEREVETAEAEAVASTKRVVAATEAATKRVAAATEQTDAHKQRADDQRERAKATRAELLDTRAELREAQDQLLETRAELRDTRSSLEARRHDTKALRDNLDAALRRAEGDLRVLVRSRSWRIAERLNTLHGLVSLKLSHRAGPVDRLTANLRRARNHLDRESSDDEEARAHRTESSNSSIAERPVESPAAASRPVATSGRPRVAVIAWDVGHNPLGRAHVMADMLQRHYEVEIWGAQFERYGTDVWAPLRDSTIPIHSYPGSTFPDHLAVMEQIAGQIDADAIWVSKPRFPSLGLGVMAKALRNRPLVLDVDDHELSFFGQAEALEPSELLGRGLDADTALPFGEAWTRVCESVIGEVDQITVSNLMLQQRFGGTIVPHARDETVFDPDLYDRDEIRSALGLDESSRLLLFGGTPRVHKGVADVVRALDRLGDDRYRLLCFGTREFNDVRKVIGPLERWTIVLPHQPFSQLPRLVGAADLACVLQDPDHPVARYQMPAKVTDAMAMGVPCLVTPVPPLQPLIDDGALLVYDGEQPLHERIAEAFDDRADMAERARRARKVFLESYSYDSVGGTAARLIGGLLADPPLLTERLSSFAELPRTVFAAGPTGPAIAAPEKVDRAAQQAIGTTDAVITDRPARIPGRSTRRAEPGQLYDVAMFWKQNDTGIYGRRQDMFLKYLARSGRVRSIVHFDRPTTPEDLYRSYRRSLGRGVADQDRLVVRQTMERLLRRHDRGPIYSHTYLHGGSRSGRIFRGEPRYVDYVRDVLDRRGFGRNPMVVWTYPTNGDLPVLIDALDADVVVADVVDDHRTFAVPGSARYDAFDRNYREVLARSDVVLANCEPVAQAMAQYAPDIEVVPNGLELLPTGPRGPRPVELRDLDGPIVGYVGNLSQRLDVELLDKLVLAHPEWQFVFVGSAHHDRSVLVLQSEPNVHFVGVKPYDEALSFLRHFDVALIPHLVNEMTRSMNPLKAFVYCSAGVPVVSTPVDNLAELGELIVVAEGVDGFERAISAALRRGRREPDLALLAPHSWEVRVDRALELIDRTAGITAIR